MRITKTLALIFAVLLGSGAMAQMYGSAIRTSMISGDFKALKNEKSVDVDFVYENMLVGNGMTNEQYITKRTKELNDKEAGRGDKWAVSWITDREKKYHPKFLELYNSRMDGKQKAGLDKDDAKYRLIVRTVSTEPGYNIGISKMPANIGASITLVETANPTEILGEMVVNNCPGGNAMGFDYDTGGRIAEAYAKLGKEVATYLQKKQWK